MICRKYIRTYPGELVDIIRSFIPSRYTEKDICLFEERFAQYVGRRHAVAVCSGRKGFELILAALGIGAGDEVIFPAYTLKDLVTLVKKAGSIPVLVDIHEKNFNINPALIERAITPRTKAIIATHLFGSPCDIKEIVASAHKRRLLVIEDCAHSLGASIDGAQTGSFGDAAFFSFELTKPINTFGGGMVVTDRADVAEWIRQKTMGLRFPQAALYKKIGFAYLERFIEKTIFFDILAAAFYFPTTTKILSILYRFLQHRGRISNYRYSSAQAFLGLRQLERLAEANRLRAEKARLLLENLDAAVEPQAIRKGVVPNFYFFVICFNAPVSSEELRKSFFIKGIDVGIKSEIADDCTSALPYSLYMPVTSKIYSRSILLPLHEGLTEGAVKIIADTCNRIIMGIRKV